MRSNLSASAAVCEPEGHRGGPSCTQLDRLPVGEIGFVVAVEGDDPLAIRLLEMGLTPGTRVRVAGRAPFGDPLELELRSYRLSIRRSEAARVTVQ